MHHVDVVLPTHERPETVPCAIRAVLGQSFGDFRLHVVGDGCDDRTEEAVRGIRDARVSFRRLSKAR